MPRTSRSVREDLDREKTEEVVVCSNCWAKFGTSIKRDNCVVCGGKLIPEKEAE